MQDAISIGTSNPSTRARRSIVSRSLAQIALSLALAIFPAACSSGEAPPLDSAGPGKNAEAEGIACKDDSDCKEGEACDQNLCQMRRCSDTSYASEPPLGSFGYVMLDRELIVATTDSIVQVVSQHGDELGVQDNVALSGAPLDVAGGNLTGRRPETLAYVVDNSNSFFVRSPAGPPIELYLGWQATRLAAGDVDGDGVDEIVALGEGGTYAVCSAVKRSCEQNQLSTPAIDVAIGDVDGDGYGEILFVGGHTLTVVNANDSATGEPRTSTQPVTPTLEDISAGDLDGDGVDEIIGWEDGGIFRHDHLYVYTLGKIDLEARATIDVSRGTLDVAFTRIGDAPRIGLLTDSGTVQLFSFASGTISQAGELDLPNGGVTRVAAADMDGNSPSVTLHGGPFLGAGPPVPIAVLTLPPYSATHSQGPSSATMGSSDDTSTSISHGSSLTTSVSLSMGGGIGWGKSVPILKKPAAALDASGGLTVGVALSLYVTNTWSHTASHSKTTGTSLSVGSSYTLTAAPQLDGYDSGGVVLAGGCYHQYDYVVDDPAGLLSAPSQVLSTFVPVGGDTSFWSTRRYNALIDALGNSALPKVSIGYKLGDVSSYPTSPTTLDGQTIPDADNVFPNPPTFRTSDVGTVSFSLTSSTNTTNTDASSFNYSHSTSIAGGVVISVLNANVQKTSDTNWGLDQSYSVTVGHSASFSGQVAPVHDDPSTPGNESTLYGYSFQPFVYLQHFTRADGQDGAYYVLTYAAGK